MLKFTRTSSLAKRSIRTLAKTLDAKSKVGISLCLVSVAVCVLCFAIVLVTEWHGVSRTWGRQAGYPTSKLEFFGGYLSYRCADDWPTPSPAPAWKGDEDFIYNLDLRIARWFRLRETWYLGDAQWDLRRAQKVKLPHFFYFRHGWDIDFNNLAFCCMIPIALFVAVNWRVLLRKRPPGFCSKCGYDMRATPRRCPECGAPGLLKSAD